MSGFGKIRNHHLRRIGIPIRSPDEIGRSQSCKLVASGNSPKLQLLIVRELVFERLFTITHATHVFLPWQH